MHLSKENLNSPSSRFVKTKSNPAEVYIYWYWWILTHFIFCRDKSSPSYLLRSDEWTNERANEVCIWVKTCCVSLLQIKGHLWNYQFLVNDTTIRMPLQVKTGWTVTVLKRFEESGNDNLKLRSVLCVSPTFAWTYKHVRCIFLSHVRCMFL